MATITAEMINIDSSSNGDHSGITASKKKDNRIIVKCSVIYCYIVSVEQLD